MKALLFAAGLAMLGLASAAPAETAAAPVSRDGRSPVIVAGTDNGIMEGPRRLLLPRDWQS